jgi:putative Ca2+/H+ antiporter (TMEM165/GDT1 family)
MYALLTSTGVVAISEVGDKTQLPAFACFLFPQTLPTVLGIFVATVLNHAAAALPAPQRGGATATRRRGDA